MPILSSGTTYPLTIPAGNALVTIDLSGTSTVTGVTREDASRWHGAGAKACNPVSTATAITISTTGKVDYRLVAGDATPSSESFKYNPVTFDSTPSDVAAVAAAINIVGETTGTEAGLLAAMSLCNSMGGGEVRLKPGVTYDLTATLPTYTNVTIVGSGWLPLYENIPDSGNTAFASGSRLRATGAFPIYLYNSGVWNPITHTDTGDLSQAEANALYGPGTAGQLAFSNTAITQSAFRNLCLDGGGVGTYGIKAGSQFRASFFYCDPADNCLITGFTKWGIWLENFIHIGLPKTQIFNCREGMCYLGASCSGSANNYLMPGNSQFRDYLSTIPTSNNLSVRGLFVTARNNTIHNLVKLDNPQSNRFNPTSFSESITMTNGVADIAVGDLSKYTEELPFVFSATTGGLPDIVGGIGGTLYVLSRSGTSGAGTVRFSWQPGISSRLFTPSAGGTVTAYTYGFPAIEFTAYDTASIQQSTLTVGSDVEAGGTAQVQFSNCMDFYCDVKTPTDSSSRSPHIAVLNSPQGEIRGNGFPAIYLAKASGGMTSSGQVRVFGTRGQAVGALGIGMWKLLSGAFQINLNASADANSSGTAIPTIAMDGGGLWLAQSRGYIGSALKNRFTTSKTISWNFDHGLVVMDGAAAVCTLPVVDANSSGNFIPIYFAQAGSIATQSSQTLNGLGLTSVPVGAGAFVIAWAQQNNGTYSWTLLSSDLGALNGVGLRNAANDAAAAALSPAVPIGGLYRNGSVVQVRIA